MTPRSSARALVVGAGGLGSPALIVLARAGVGTVGIADDDVVEVTNLHRQILFDEADVGTDKVEAAARATEVLGGGAVKLERHATRLLPDNAVELVSGYDIVLEGSDNFATKFLAADACAIAGVPIVHAAAVRWYGTVLAVAARGAPCYRCLFEDLPTGNAPNCAEAGVVGPMVGVVGALLAALALSMLDGAQVAGTLLTFDAKTDRLRRRAIRARAGCALCGGPETRRISSIDPARYGVADGLAAP